MSQHPLEGAAEVERVRIYVDEHDTWHGRPLALAVMQALHDGGAAGVTVFRGLAGFGAHGRIHTATLPDLGSPLPMLVEWIDHADQVARLMPTVEAMVRHGLVTVETVRVAHFARRE